MFAVPVNGWEAVVDATSGQASGSGEGIWAGRIDTTVAHPARRYNYWLGGKDNFAADRESGDKIASVYPPIKTAARENRAFLQRAVRYLAAEAGIRQFLDVGTGIPTADNTHEVAQGIAPESRVAYVDNDPIVLTHARALLQSSPEGATAYLDADLREPERILGDPQLRSVLDLSKPVALMLIAIVHFLQDAEQPHKIVRRLLDALAPGSFLVMSHGTLDLIPPHILARAADHVAVGRVSFDMIPRPLEEVSRFFDGLEVVEPGIVPVTEWRPTVPESERPSLAEAAIYGGVARLP